MPASPVLYDGGVLVPAHLELCESSGPVSPRFQYEINVSIEAAEGSITLSYDERQGATRTATPQPQPVSAEAYARLWEKLAALDALGQHGDLVGPSRDRVGVSFNHVTLRLGTAEARTDYLLPDVEEPANQRLAAIVQALKDFARAYAPDDQGLKP